MFKKVFAGISALAICAMSMPAAALTSFADADLHDVNMNLGTVSTTGAIVDGKLAESEKVVLDITIDKNEGFHAMSAFFDIQQPEGASLDDGTAIVFTAINARKSEFGASNSLAGGAFTTNSWKDGGDNSKYNPSFVYNTGLSGEDTNTYVTGLYAPTTFVVPAGTPEGAYRVGFATNADGTLNVIGSVTQGAKEVGANITYTAGYIIVGNADIPDESDVTTTTASSPDVTTSESSKVTTAAPTTSVSETTKNPDATDGFEIEIGTVEVEAGAKEAVVPITVKKNPGLQALTMGLDYNTSDIQLQKFDLTEDFLYTEDGETFGELTKDEKTGYLVWQKADGLETDLTGVMINLTFAITDAKAGDKYPIKGVEAMASKEDHVTRIVPNIIDGAIVVKGDSNDDVTDGFEIEIGTVEVEVGAKEAVVPITVKKNPGLQALTMGLDYNTDDIQLQKFDLTEDFLYTEDGETFGELTKDEKTGYLVWQKADGLETDLTGVMINLTFAITDAKAGDKYPIKGIDAMASKEDHVTRIVPKVIDGAIVVKDDNTPDVTDGFEIEIGTVEVEAGAKEAVVPITVKKNPGLQALTMGLEYNTDDIQLQKFDLTEDFLYTEDGETFGELTKDEKTGYLVWQKADGLETDLTGVMINLTFAITDAKAGDKYPITGVDAMASKEDHVTRIVPKVIDGAIIVKDSQDVTDGFEIEIGTVEVEAGAKEAVVPITIKKNPGLQALTMGLEYNSDDIQLQKFDLTEDFLYTEDGETFGELTKDEKTGYLVWQKADGLETDLTGVMINLTFAITDAKAGDKYPIKGIEAMASKEDHVTRIVPKVIDGAIIVKDSQDVTDGFEIEIGTVHVPAGTKEAVVPITIIKNPGLQALTMGLEYNSDDIQLQKFDLTEDFLYTEDGETFGELTKDEKTGYLVWQKADGLETDLTGVMINLTFAITDAQPGDEYPINGIDAMASKEDHITRIVPKVIDGAIIVDPEDTTETTTTEATTTTVTTTETTKATTEATTTSAKPTETTTPEPTTTSPAPTETTTVTTTDTPAPTETTTPEPTVTTTVSVSVSESVSDSQPATDGFEIEIGTVHVPAGTKEAVVPITIVKNPGLQALTMGLEYNSDDIQLQKFDLTEDFLYTEDGETFGELTKDEKTGYLVWQKADGLETSLTGIMINLTFAITDAQPGDEYPINGIDAMASKEDHITRIVPKVINGAIIVDPEDTTEPITTTTPEPTTTSPAPTETTTPEPTTTSPAPTETTTPEPTTTSPAPTETTTPEPTTTSPAPTETTTETTTVTTTDTPAPTETTVTTTDPDIDFTVTTSGNQNPSIDTDGTTEDPNNHKVHRRLGDVDNNDEVTSYDALLILQNVVQVKEFNYVDNAVADVADMKQGEITSYDALKVLQLVVELIENFDGATFVDVTLDANEVEVPDTRVYYDADNNALDPNLEYTIRQQ